MVKWLWDEALNLKVVGFESDQCIMDEYFSQLFLENRRKMKSIVNISDLTNF